MKYEKNSSVVFQPNVVGRAVSGGISGKYRRDIDGLRAFAIVSVVLFHAGIDIFSGGFVGVDIFFVISGYLISGIIIDEINGRTFIISDFVARRVRRILPAQFVMMLSVAIAGYFISLPIDLIETGKTYFFQSFLLGNYNLYKTDDYFGGESALRPLLHVWSLAVEEQFYVLFPPFLLVLWRLGFCRLAYPLILTCLLSFAFSQWILHTDNAASFYLLPSRAWELLVGAVARMALGHACRGWVAEVLAGLGIALILFAVFFYSAATPFPGLAAIVPVFGCALVLYANGGSPSMIGRLLSVRPLVDMGLISYSLYLWHWPVLAYTRVTTNPVLGWPLSLAPIAASVVLAIISYHFIEKPLRHGALLAPVSRALWSGGAMVIGSAAIAAAVLLSDGLENRFSPQVVAIDRAHADKNPRRAECNHPSLSAIASLNVCKTAPGLDSEPAFLIWGDSHADAVSPLFYKISAETGIQGMAITYSGCPPLVGVSRLNKRGDCQAHNNAVMAAVRKKRFANVILIGAWHAWFQNPEKRFGISQDAMEAALRTTVEELRATGAKVFILRTVPMQWPHYLKSLIAASNDQRSLEQVGLSMGEYLEGRRRYERVFETDGITATAQIIDPLQAFCGGGVCSAFWQGQTLYYNSSHLSVAGSMRLEPQVRKVFERFQGPP